MTQHGRPNVVGPPRTIRSGLLEITVAWIAIVLLSPLSEIVWRAFLNRPQPSWDPIVRLSLIAAIVAVVWLVPRLAPVRAFMAAILAFAIGQMIRVGIESVPPYAPWASTVPTQSWVFVDSLLGFIPGALMIATAVVISGLRRRDMFLTIGNIAAPSGLRIWGRDVRWSVLGPVLLPIITGGLIVQLVLTIGPHGLLTTRLLSALPLAVAFALINPIAEEIRYRCVLLAHGMPVFGAAQALAMTTVVFALGHWYGHPSGPTGVVLAGLAGGVWGWSIIRTRGLTWAWLIHAVQDLVILLLISTAT